MAIARVQLPNGRIARFEVPEGTSPAEAEEFARLGIDGNTGNFEESLVSIRAAMLGKTAGSSGTRAPVTLPFGLGQFSVGGAARDFVQAASNVDDKTSTPIVFGTLGALATGGTSVIPSVLGAGIGGGSGGALAESQDPNSTPESIARAALRDGATMAGSEAAGFGLGALANRLIAPNLGRYADPMRPVREAIGASRYTQFLREQARRIVASLPSTGRVGTVVQRAGRFAASPLGGEVLEAAVVPAATALGGPQLGIPLYLARAMFAPGVLQRYLARSRLPNELARLAGRQAVTTAIGAGALEEQRR